MNKTYNRKENSERKKKNFGLTHTEKYTNLKVI